MRSWKALLLLATLSCMVSGAMGQGISAIVGTTTDQSSAVLGGVDIVVIDTATGYQRTATTGSDVTAGAWMTLVIPVVLVVVMIAWGWKLRRRAE